MKENLFQDTYNHIYEPDMILVNNQEYYKIPNGTSYDYAPIPKQFRLYFDKLKQQNEELKQRLNWIAFGDDSELALRYLRKIGYIDFDEERKVYINKHNNDPFLLQDETEKDYYIKDEELDEYTKQLEYKYNKQKEIIDKAIQLRNDFAKDNLTLIFENNELINFMNNLLNTLEDRKN